MTPATFLHLAQVSAGSLDDSALAYGFKLLVLSAGLVALLVTIWDKIKPRPAHSEVYATKDETRAIREEARLMAARISKSDEKTDQLRVDVARSYSDLQASDEARTSVLHRRLDSMQEVLRQISEKVGAAHHV